MTETTGPWASSPTTARRWLGREMRRRRVVAGVEPKAAADALRCSLAKVTYTESGEHGFKPRDLTEILFHLYEVPDDQQEQLLMACRVARGRGWWQAYDPDTLPEWVHRYVGLEQGASSLRAWDALLPNGLLQVRPYARALMGDVFDQDEVATRLELRLQRQDILTRRPDPLEAHFVFDEGILHRIVDGPAVMSAQLDHLVEVAERPNVTIQVVPFTAGPHPAASGGFTTLGFGGADDDPGVVYVEGSGGAAYFDDPAEVQDYDHLFDELRADALAPEETSSFIRQLAKDHRP